MQITEQSINHLAQLSSLQLSPEEKKALITDLGSILKYIERLNELDTEGVPPTFQVSGLTNVWRSDELQPQDASPEALLALARETKDGQVKVPKIL